MNIREFAMRAGMNLLALRTPRVFPIGVLSADPFGRELHRLLQHLSVGSAVMSPMVFEKSLSMAQNLELQEGRKITRHHMVIVDLAESTWDWQQDGEPPMDNPAYYLRYCKTFSRMGGTMRYVRADNRISC